MVQRCISPVAFINSDSPPFNYTFIKDCAIGRSPRCGNTNMPCFPHSSDSKSQENQFCRKTQCHCWFTQWELTLLVNSSRTNVITLALMPMKRFTLVSTTYAVLGILNIKDAGYMRGVMDHLAKNTDRHWDLFTYSSLVVAHTWIKRAFLTHRAKVEVPKLGGWLRIHRISAGSR